MTQKKFEKLVNEAIKTIPEKFLKKLDNVVIFIKDEPNSYQGQFLTLGLYEGIPQTERWHYSQVLPDKITIFKKPIEKLAFQEANLKLREEKIKQIIKETVWHEIAHHFGMNEKEVREGEKRRIKKIIY